MLDLDQQPAAGNDNEMPRAPHGRLPLRFYLIFAGLVAAIPLGSIWWALSRVAP